MKVSKYASPLPEVICTIVVIKEKVLKRGGLWCGFCSII